MNAPANTAVSQLSPEAQAGLEQDIESAVLAHAGLRQDQADDGGDALRLVGASSAALRHCESMQKDAVLQARRAGRSWAELGALIGISRQAAQQRFAPDPGAAWFVKDWHAEYHGHDILVRNSWNQGLKVFVDGKQVAENKQIFAVDAGTPFISVTVTPKGEPGFDIDIVVRAFVHTRVKILVDGKQIGGDQF